MCIPLVLAGSQTRTVGVEDVAEAAFAALKGRIPPRSRLDLVEREARSLATTVAHFRAWLGLPEAPVLRLPAVVGSVASMLADGLGWLGWRSPLRSTALRVLSEGLHGDPDHAHLALGRDAHGLGRVLAQQPAGAQELWFARLWLLKPMILGVLALFWIVSGLVGVLRADAAIELLTRRGLAAGPASAFVWTGDAVDVFLGLAILGRPTARLALVGMVTTTGLYLLGSVAFAPDLWLDPLGPMVKALPVLVLALVGLAVLPER